MWKKLKIFGCRWIVTVIILTVITCFTRLYWYPAVYALILYIVKYLNGFKIFADKVLKFSSSYLKSKPVLLYKIFQ